MLILTSMEELQSQGGAGEKCAVERHCGAAWTTQAHSSERRHHPRSLQLGTAGEANF